ncbi:MAG: septal ring lytic transglycosylase RlpA family protein [Xanthobacteraceae bacterium]
MGEAFSLSRRIGQAAAAIAACLLVANCSSSSKLTSRVDPRYGVAASPRVVEPGQPVPKGGGVYRVGKPYQVAGVTYTPEENSRYRNEGLASWYGDDFHGRLTANGEIYDMAAISAAHPTLPMPSYVRVTNMSTRKSLIVRVNDRGPYHRNREIDVSAKAAELLGFRHHGTARVRVEYVGPAPLEGTDDRQLVATLREGQPAPAPVVMVASNRFLPNFGRAPIRNGAPLPQERPFDLGESADQVAATYPRQSNEMTRLASEALSRHPIDPRYVDISPDTEPPRVMAARLRAQEARDMRAAETSASRAGGPWVQAAPAPSPVAAYAPIHQDGALASGRGLY